MGCEAGMHREQGQEGRDVLPGNAFIRLLQLVWSGSVRIVWPHRLDCNTDCP